MIYEMGKVSALGRDRSHGGLVEAPLVRVDEKIDGSQISFGVREAGLWVRSRTRFVSVHEPDAMFSMAVAQIKKREPALDTLTGWTFVGEYLQKPKHNVLCYDRAPEGNIVLFDAVDPDGNVANYSLLKTLGQHLELEVVQTKLMAGDEALRLARSSVVYETSQLGGIAEGCVIKTDGGHTSTRIIAKVVAEQFKEVKGDRPARVGNDKQDIAISMANKYCPPARYHKAVQKLKEVGEYTGQMRDVPKLLKLVREDIETECGEEIKETLYEAFRKDILRMACQPIAGWYDQYLNSAFGEMKREQEANTGAEL